MHVSNIADIILISEKSYVHYKLWEKWLLMRHYDCLLIIHTLALLLYWNIKVTWPKSSVMYIWGSTYTAGIGLWTLSKIYCGWRQIRQFDESTAVKDGLLTVSLLCATIVMFLKLLTGWLVGFYRISAFIGSLKPNQFFIQIVLFQTIQFSRSTQFKSTYNLIAKNISISSYSVLSSSSNSANSV